MDEPDEKPGHGQEWEGAAQADDRPAPSATREQAVRGSRNLNPPDGLTASRQPMCRMYVDTPLDPVR